MVSNQSKGVWYKIDGSVQQGNVAVVCKRS